MLSALEAIPLDAEFFLVGVDTPVMVLGGKPYTFELANRPPEEKAPGFVATGDKITRYEFLVRVVTRESQLFIVNGVAIAVGGFAATLGRPSMPLSWRAGTSATTNG